MADGAGAWREARAGRHPETQVSVRRASGPGDVDVVADVQEVAFGRRPSASARADLARIVDADRCVVVSADGIDAGVGYSVGVGWSLPGGGSIAASAVSGIGILPTHRGRGLMGAILAELGEIQREQCEPVAVLKPTSGTLYPRSGFGPATWFDEVAVPSRIRFHPGTPMAGGSFELVRDGEDVGELVELWDVVSAARNGEISRSRRWWDAMLAADHRWWSPPASRIVARFRGLEGRCDGSVIFSVSEAWSSHGRSEALLEVWDLAARTIEVEAAIWRWLLDLDPVASVRAVVACDHPLRWWAEDPRDVVVEARPDRLWARVDDPVAAFSARRYDDGPPGTIGIGGDRRLRIDPAGPVVAWSDAEPDVDVEPRMLASLLVGSSRASVLAQAGWLRERRPGGIRAIDRLLASEAIPWCSTRF